MLARMRVTTLKILSDENYDLAKCVVFTMNSDIMDMWANANSLGRNLEIYDKMTLTRLKCYSTTADTWYMNKSHPRTVLYAILINSVHEYILEKYKNIKSDEFPWLSQEIWEHVLDVIDKERNEIKSKVDNLGINEVIDIDAWHNKMIGELNVNI
jgi:hypothetical protein